MKTQKPTVKRKTRRQVRAVVSRVFDPEKMGFGQRIKIHGRNYWLSPCVTNKDCPSGSKTFHILKGLPPRKRVGEEQ